MIKKLIILILLCNVSILYAANQNIYIDSSAADGGDGSISTPYDEFADINWTTGGANSIFDWIAADHDPFVNLKAGEVFEETLTIGASGSADHHIIIRKYGSGDNPIITNVSGRGVYSLNKSYIEIHDITVTDCNDENLFFNNSSLSSDSGGIKLQNIVANNSVTDQGIFIKNANEVYQMSDIDIINCSTSGNFNSGIDVKGHIDDVLISGCTSSGDAIGEDSDWGIIVHGYIVIWDSDENWVNVSGDIYYHETTLTVMESVIIKKIGHYVDGGDVTPELGEYYLDTTPSPNRLYINYDGNPSNERILVGMYITDAHIWDCMATNTGCPEAYGIGMETACFGCSINRSVSYNNGDNCSGIGIMCGSNVNCTVNYCLSYGNTEAGFGLNTTQNAVFRNCISINNGHNYDNGKSGIVLNYHGDAEITNCIFAYNKEYGIDVNAGYYGPITVTNDYNCVYGNLSGGFDNLSKGTNSIEKDPVLYDYESGNARLKEYSPCIDAGTNVGIYSDIESNPVPCGSGWDIGAYEYQIRSISGNIQINGNVEIH